MWSIIFMFKFAYGTFSNQIFIRKKILFIYYKWRKFYILNILYDVL